MKETIKEKVLRVRDFILAQGKIVFPILLIAAVAVTVIFALNAGSDKVETTGTPDTEVAVVSDGNAIEDTVLTVLNTPLVGPDTVLPEEEKKIYDAMQSLLVTYYQAVAEGDVDTISAIQSSMEDMERIRIVELGKYIESYPVIEVYYKPGPETNSYVVIAYTHAIMSYYPEDYFPGFTGFYVCSREDGTLYINQETVEPEIAEYIRQIYLQDDVVELCNKIEVEYKEICLNKPELFNYIAEVEQQIKQAVGEILASEMNGDVSGGDATVSGGDSTVSDGDATNEEPEVVVPAGPVYATATTTVNVRSSDSEEADKLGKVSRGTKVEVLEQRPNGWTKIVYEGGEGYIKSEFLEVAESAAGVEVIGTVTTTANVNVRASASQSSDKLGVAVGGSTLDLIAIEGDWCKVVYEGQIGYVKAEFVQQ
ncbi:MAG: SH3 domain-containing protein [Lachnospiraceae bacterium]|nr:SH3 domain-containing protein [Lachnospiraceae bacterium]